MARKTPSPFEPWARAIAKKIRASKITFTELAEAARLWALYPDLRKEEN